MFGASADDGITALDQIPLLHADDVVFKSHGMDQRFLKLFRLSDARLLISVRDPRDSVVSQRERFNASLNQATMDISRALATICSIPSDIPMLRFEYEDGFTRTPETVARVAQFLGLPAGEPEIAEIFNSLLPDRVCAQIAERLAALPVELCPTHDPITQWHPGHIGDGRVGKWQDKLDITEQTVVSGCLNALAVLKLKPGHEVLWAPRLFSYPCGIEGGDEVTLACNGDADYAAWGPYLCLPAGRWRAVAHVFADSLSKPSIEADVYLPWELRQLASCHSSLNPSGTPNITLDFEHRDHFQPVECRLRTIDGSTGTIRFAGWKLYWTGPVR